MNPYNLSTLDYVMSWVCALSVGALLFAGILCFLADMKGKRK